MSRESHAEQQIPQDGAASVPYADQYEIARALMGRGAEMVAGSVTTPSSGTLDVTDLPFDPAAVVLINETDAGLFVHTPSMGDGEMLKLTDTPALSFVSSNGITLGDKQFTIGTDSDLNGNGDTVHYLAIGFPDKGDSFD